MSAARRRGLTRLTAWLRAVLFTVVLAVLTAWGVGDDGRVMPMVVVAAAALGLGFLYWLFPRGLHFAFGTATGLAIYASLFVVLSRAQFPQAPDWSRAPAFLLPVFAFLVSAWWRRGDLAGIVGREDEHDLAELPHTLRWVLFTALIGLVCFVLPVNRLEPWAQAAALLISMAAIAGIVALSVRDVVRLLVDVALIMHEVSDRARHMMVPATAFLLMYALLVVVFAAAYRISDGLSIVSLFNGPGGPMRISYSDALHFSIATLSTVGYGDIHPQDDGIRVLASIQVVLGQLLLLFGVAEILRARRRRGGAGTE
ncbi:potassium channel family protein [Falsiroseomonas oryzae]|uniref:potassium channel family protein n=1 Tax=Falsiroseomonas oryzae TaxID=2766473 RepID=UPI0022EB7458|nr:potassium channel family protein [Roseomonas sp. MO-31]